MKSDIFLSYRQADREIAVQLARELERRGLAVWYDAEVEGAQEWREEIGAALEASAMLVILFSESCNESGELKKELVLADSLEKPVVPILIENCRPKGACAHQLADRNWIEAWPEPHSRILELAGLLAGLAGKSPVAAVQTGDPQQPVSGLDLAAVQSAAPGMASAYIGKKDKRLARAARRPDILPFLWIDLIALVPLFGGLGFLVWSGTQADPSGVYRSGLAALVCVAGLGLYGAIAFPARYYMRGRPVALAIRSYVLSSAILLGIAGTLAAIVKLRGGMSVELAPTAILVGFIWGALAIIAFTIYGVLAGQRALARFNANLRQI